MALSLHPEKIGRVKILRAFLHLERPTTGMGIRAILDSLTERRTGGSDEADPLGRTTSRGRAAAASGSGAGANDGRPGRQPASLSTALHRNRQSLMHRMNAMMAEMQGMMAGKRGMMGAHQGMMRQGMMSGSSNSSWSGMLWSMQTVGQSMQQMMAQMDTMSTQDRMASPQAGKTLRSMQRHMRGMMNSLKGIMEEMGQLRPAEAQPGS